MSFCLIVRFKQNNIISSKINDHGKQIHISRLVSMQNSSVLWTRSTDRSCSNFYQHVKFSSFFYGILIIRIDGSYMCENYK